MNQKNEIELGFKEMAEYVSTLHFQPQAGYVLVNYAKCEVIGEGGGPMPDTAVALIPAGTYTPARLSVYARQMRTDSSGVFEVGALSPGDY